MSAPPAVRVSPRWLDLREPADAAARSGELAERLARRLVAGGPGARRAPAGGPGTRRAPGAEERPAPGALVIHDLGGGSGSMGRWLAPRLPGPQHWVVHDRDPDLLELAAAGAPEGVTVEARQSDVTRLAPEDLAGADAVVTSALLDLLTAAELGAMLRACAGTPMLLGLTVVGRVALTPADPLDARIAAAFNAHQRREGKLGPVAVAAAVRELRDLECVVRPSHWRLGAADAGLTAEWLDGWVAAACEQEPELAGDAAHTAYLTRRLAQAAAGKLAVTVEHADLLVLP